MHRMRAGILAVGSELLGADRTESNSLRLSGLMQRFGVGLQRKVVVGDVADDIAGELARMLADLDLVVVCGGLGPTRDDLTREAAARALGRRLILDEGLLEDLRGKFRRFGLEMPEVNRCQAELIEGAAVLANPRGTAPGMRIELEERALFLLPGVPQELEGLMESALTPWLRARTGGSEIETRILRVACLAESALEERIAPLYREFEPRAISVLASPGDIQLRFTASGRRDERRARLEAMASRARALLGEAIYASGADASLEGVVGELLTARGRTLATAESCTGGLVAERITRVPGSSAYFLGAVVAYSDLEKQRLLAVSAASLARRGAVSREVVLEMASGVIERLGSDYGIAISGIAGPDGGSEDKPVGTVHLAVGERDGEPRHRELRLPGDRRRVRWLASQWALDSLRRRLLEAEPHP